MPSDARAASAAGRPLILPLRGLPSRARRQGRFALAAIALAFLAPSIARAQDGSDAALDALIKEIDADKKADANAKREDPKKAEEPKKPAEKTSAEGPKKPGAEPSGKPTPKPAELSGKDKELDALLESLGETKDEPKARDERKPPGMPGGEDEDRDKNKGPGDADKNKDQDPNQGPGEGRERQPRLTDRDKDIDEELEELSGRRRKKGRDQDQQGEGSGPMGEIIKEMRDVENRLGEPDTGDETRGKQQQLVKRLETLIEQIRKESQQQSGMARRQGRQNGGKQGEQEGDQASDNPGGAPNQRPKSPTDRHSLVGGKDAWGHLPPELRQEIENVSKEDSLPISAELIRRYYLAVSRGKLNRGE